MPCAARAFMSAAWIVCNGSASAEAFPEPPPGRFPFTEVPASIASRSRLYSSSRRCSAKDNAPFTAVETGACLYSSGGIELELGVSPFAMDDLKAAALAR